jgi:hypothetical protein
MFSRYLVIALALGAAAYRASQGAWIESIGLLGLGLGLIALKVSATRPQLRAIAYLGFLVTALSIGAVLYRNYLSGP